jgi:hypothetical protein
MPATGRFVELAVLLGTPRWRCDVDTAVTLTLQPLAALDLEGFCSSSIGGRS